jgi:hypothetical protein
LEGAAMEGTAQGAEHRPRSSVLLFSRLMGENFAGTPVAECFLTSE